MQPEITHLVAMQQLILYANLPVFFSFSNFQGFKAEENLESSMRAVSGYVKSVVYFKAPGRIYVANGERVCTFSSFGSPNYAENKYNITTELYSAINNDQGFGKLSEPIEYYTTGKVSNVIYGSASQHIHDFGATGLGLVEPPSMDWIAIGTNLYKPSVSNINNINDGDISEQGLPEASHYLARGLAYLAMGLLGFATVYWVWLKLNQIKKQSFIDRFWDTNKHAGLEGIMKRYAALKAFIWTSWAFAWIIVGYTWTAALVSFILAGLSYRIKHPIKPKESYPKPPFKQEGKDLEVEQSEEGQTRAGTKRSRKDQAYRAKEAHRGNSKQGISYGKNEHAEYDEATTIVFLKGVGPISATYSRPIASKQWTLRSVYDASGHNITRDVRKNHPEMAQVQAKTELSEEAVNELKNQLHSVKVFKGMDYRYLYPISVPKTHYTSSEVMVPQPVIADSKAWSAMGTILVDDSGDKPVYIVKPVLSSRVDDNWYYLDYGTTNGENLTYKLGTKFQGETKPFHWFDPWTSLPKYFDETDLLPNEQLRPDYKEEGKSIGNKTLGSRYLMEVVELQQTNEHGLVTETCTVTSTTFVEDIVADSKNSASELPSVAVALTTNIPKKKQNKKKKKVSFKQEGKDLIDFSPIPIKVTNSLDNIVIEESKPITKNIQPVSEKKHAEQPTWVPKNSSSPRITGGKKNL
jgi:hypothetical protein